MSQFFIKHNTYRNIILFIFYSFVSMIFFYFIYSTYFSIDSLPVIPTEINNTSDLSSGNVCDVGNSMGGTEIITENNPDVGIDNNPDVNNNPDVDISQGEVSSNTVEESDPFRDYKWDGWEYEYEAPMSHMHSPIYNPELYAKAAPLSSTGITDTGNVDVTVVEISDSSNTDNSPIVSEPYILEEQSILADQTPPSIINTHFDASLLVEDLNNLERQSDSNSSDVSDATISADTTIPADITIPADSNVDGMSTVKSTIGNESQYDSCYPSDDEDVKYLENAVSKSGESSNLESNSDANSDPSATGHFNSFDDLVNNNLLGDGEDNENFPDYDVDSDDVNSDDDSDYDSESENKDNSDYE